MRKKLFSILLALVFVMGLMPAQTAFAEGGSLKIGDETVDIENGGTYCGGKVVYDASTNTLTLNDLELTASYNNCINAYLDDLTIKGSAKLTSENTIAISIRGKDTNVGQELPGNLTLDGDFTISAPRQSAISLHGGTLTVAGGNVHLTSEYGSTLSVLNLVLGGCSKITLPEDGSWQSAKEVKIESPNHSWSESWKYDDWQAHWKECTRCGAIAEWGEHTFGEVKYDWSDDYTSCTASFACTVCGYSEWEEADEDGPSYAVRTINKEPTCTEDGEMTCTANFIKLEFPGTRTVVSIPALGHTEETDKGADPTCTEPGKTEGKHCSVCNEVLVAQKTVDPLGHDWGDWKVTVEPEIGKAGVKEHECTRCKIKETEAIPALIGYTVSSGGDTSWTKGGSGSIIITVNRSEDDENCFTHYAETLIDGNPVTVSAKAGSTVVEIGADVLNSLGTGTHTITVRFDDGEAVTTVNVKEKQDDSFPIKSPDTSGRGGYDKMALLLTGVMVLTLAGAVTVRRYTE